MKNIIIYSAFCYSFLLTSMELKVGTFSHAQNNKKQHARYDLKQLGDNVGIGLFDGRNGPKVAILCEEEFFDNTGYFLRYQRHTVEDSLLNGLRTCNFDAMDSKDNRDPINNQSSMLVASWTNLKTRENNLILLGDSFGCFIGKHTIKIIPPQKSVFGTTDSGNTESLINVIGNKNNKERMQVGDHFYFLASKQHSHTIENDYSYLVLATHSLFDILDNENDEERNNDLKRIFFNALNEDDIAFDKIYPLPNGVTIKLKEGNTPIDFDAELRHGLQNVTQNPAMRILAKKLVQVALSRGCNKNVTVIVQSLTK